MSNWQALYLWSVVWELDVPACVHVPAHVSVLILLSLQMVYENTCVWVSSGKEQIQIKLIHPFYSPQLIFSSPFTVFSSSSQNQYVSVTKCVWFYFFWFFSILCAFICQTHFFFVSGFFWVSGIDLVSLITWQSSPSGYHLISSL